MTDDAPGGEPDTAAIAPIDATGTAGVEGKKPTVKKPPKVSRDLVKEADAAIAKAEKKKKKNKKRLSTGKKIGLGVLALLALVVYYGLQPLVGTPRYGVCRTFIELELPYPSTLQINAVEEAAQSVRVYFSHIDAFGSSRLNMIECEYRMDPQRGLMVSAISINRQPVAADKLKAFNYIVGYILANPPDLTLPRFRSDSLADLKIDYY